MTVCSHEALYSHSQCTPRRIRLGYKLHGSKAAAVWAKLTQPCPLSVLALTACSTVTLLDLKCSTAQLLASMSYC